jgi:formiminoglutamate deiminase
LGRSSVILVQRAWLGGESLADSVRIEIDDGLISSIESGGGSDGEPALPGVALPGLVNAHSHAFHRLLRGRTHRQGGDFWAWRDRMYETAADLTPESYEELATAVYTEMALAGITTVGEFHYVHHQKGGRAYEDPNEMGHALVRAARRAGIRLTLLDAGYFTSGFAGEPLTPVQQRFSDGSASRWIERVAELMATYEDASDVRVGLAPHSVRAVPERDLEVVSEAQTTDMPLHIHLSEQPAENLACLDSVGLTPTGLLDRLGLLRESTTAVHATHVNVEDIAKLGAAGAGVCYCATTERDLADGIGPSGALRDAGATLCVGSDSHAVIDLFEETRGVEMHERLRSGRRGVFAPAELAGIATHNGSGCLGFQGGHLEVGKPADITIVSGETPRTQTSGDGIGAILFSATAADVTDVIVGGSRIVSGGHHPEWETARRALAHPGR